MAKVKRGAWALYGRQPVKGHGVVAIYRKGTAYAMESGGGYVPLVKRTRADGAVSWYWRVK